MTDDGERVARAALEGAHLAIGAQVGAVADRQVSRPAQRGKPQARWP